MIGAFRAAFARMATEGHFRPILLLFPSLDQSGRFFEPDYVLLFIQMTTWSSRVSI